ncbi:MULTISPECIES: hypothetical protein [unclassified Olleya]|uniref:hypothetical protein n=1 Tax=unclassified Olleya TaxID=2615019 RepID=UPI0011AC3F42|nr:hypothetical protein [Olleya sp. Hel_I_94]TVZ46698.1 hypothetical protein JM82_1277 [Olleya sp. Hel_I_94]
MLKKVIYFLIVILVLFIGMVYWSTSSTDQTFKTSQLVNIDNVNAINFHDLDSVLVAASALYKADEIKILFQGEQYRAAWATPIKAPVLFLDTLFGGVTITKEGGGKQTHSLKLETKEGVELTLRGINKDPKPLIPEFVKTLGLENIIVDGISAQHPYSAILAAELANKSAIINTKPKVVFLPKQPLLGDYNNKYGNRLFLLEYETESKTNWTNLSNVSEIVDTKNLQELKLSNTNNIFIDKSALIRARLFDLLVGDWDRHTKQWGWAIQQTDQTYTAIPIAGDRDNAFINLEGIIPSILSNENVVEQLRPFDYEIDFMPGLVYPFDQYFLLNTEENLFIQEAKQLQLLLNDEALLKALKVWPSQILDIDGEEIISKIKTRRDNLVSYAKLFKTTIDKKGLVTQRLKGSEDLNLPEQLQACFECYTKY